jgi:RNA polymerase sigma factor (sigma-70 family)
MMTHDMELVREYAEHHSERAFETLVSRHISLVYSSALRQARDPHLAEEITQAVFIILARKAGSLSPKTILPGWLYRTTGYTAANVLRVQSNRQRREQEAYMQSTTEDAVPQPDWLELSPLLDDAMSRLGQADRDALLLRFFKNKTLQEVGEELGVAERAAQKRVARGLEKLRAFFSRRGVQVSVVFIAGAVAANSVQAAPPALIQSVSVAAIANGGAASASTLALVKGGLKLLAWAKAKSIIAGIIAVCFVGTTIFVIAEARDSITYAMWMTIAPNLDQLNPVLILRRTRFPLQQVASSKHGKRLDRNIPFYMIFQLAYGDIGPVRWINYETLGQAGEFNGTNGYDLMLTLPDRRKEALQTAIKRQFGIVAYREIQDADVLLLQVKNPHSANIKPGVGKGLPWTDATDIFDKPYSVVNAPMESFRYALEYSLGIPVVDRTGLTNTYDIKFFVDPPPNANQGAQKPVRMDDADQAVIEKELLDQLGFELVPSHEPIEMLVIEKAK